MRSNTNVKNKLVYYSGIAILVILAVVIPSFSGILKAEEVVVEKKSIGFNESVNFTYNLSKVRIDKNGARLLNNNSRADATLMNPVRVVSDKVTGFEESAFKPGGSGISYQLTTDFKNWHYFDGNIWRIAPEDCRGCTNNVGEINDNIKTLLLSSDSFQIKAFLSSDKDNIPFLYSVSLVTETKKANLSTQNDLVYRFITSLAESTPPTCDGKTATIWVNSGKIVGGPDDGKTYKGDLNGTNGVDVIVGTTGNDNITGDEGDDTICALEGNNEIYGNEGNDTVFAGNGNDTIEGNDGNDYIDAGNGDNNINGGKGYDTIITGSGIDDINGYKGNDKICSGEGNDKIDGGEDDDRIDADGGQNEINGGGDDDICLNGNKKIEHCEDTTTDVGCGYVVKLPPVANNDSASTPSETSVLIDVIANDSDSDGTLNPASVAVTSSPTHGSITAISAVTGKITYQPSNSFSGTDTFEYQVCDNDALCDTATVTVNVTAEEGKTTICHFTSSETNPYNVITVSDSALKTHEDHHQDIIPITDRNSDGEIDEDDCKTETGPPSCVASLYKSAQGSICQSSYRPIGTNGSPASFVLTARFKINPNDPTNPNASGSTGTVFIGNDGVGVKSDSCGGSEGISGGGGNQDEEVIITFDAPTPKNSIIISINIFSSGSDEPVIFVTDTNSNIYTINESEILSALTGGDINFAGLSSIPNGKLITKIKVRETKDHITISKILGGCSACGNGILDSGEQCDDGNMSSGDGCSSTCQTETNLPPDAKDDSISTLFNTPIAVDVLLNDTDPDDGLNPASVTVTINPNHGSITGINGANGKITYAPSAGYQGTDTFTYKVCDMSGQCDTAVVTVTVSPPDLKPPTAQDDHVTISSGASLDIDVLSNDSDPDGILDPSTVIITTDPEYGSITSIDPLTGKITYISNTGFTGDDTFFYQVCDNDGLCDIAEVFIDVTPAIKLPPVAEDNSATTQEDAAVTIDVLANDSDPDGTINPATVTITGNPSHGTITNIDPVTGEITYTPGAGFSGNDSFVYQVCDNDALCDTATVDITVLPSDKKTTICHFTDSGSNPFVVITVSDNALKTHEDHHQDIIPITDRNSDGKIDEADCVYNEVVRSCGQGIDLCTWDTVLPLGSPDNGNNCNLNYNTEWPINTDKTVSCTFNKANYSDYNLYISIDNDVLNCTLNGNTIVDNVLHENCTPQDPRNGYHYLITPVNGTNTLTCIVRDRGSMSFFDSCVVGGDIIPPPVCGNGILEDGEQCDDGNANSGDGCSSTCQTEATPVATINAYKVVCDNESDLPNWGNGGSDITATTASAYVAQSNGHCQLVSGWNFQWNHDKDIVNGGFVGEASGWNSFSTPTSGTNPAKVLLTAQDINNDADLWFREILESDYIPFTSPPKGLLEDNVSAEFYCNNDILNYDNLEWINNIAVNQTYYCVGFNVLKIITPICGNGIVEAGEQCDDGGTANGDGCNSTCQTEVENQPPIAVNDSISTDQGNPVIIDVLSNDSATDGALSTSTVAVTANPANGTITAIDPATGNITYAPNPGFSGSDNFTYQVCDTNGLCDTAIVSITVNPPAKQAPDAQDDIANTEVNKPVEIDILVNDSDSDGTIDPSSVVVTINPLHGVITNIDAVTGKVTYTPNNGYTGDDSFTYRVCDDDGLCDTALVSVNVAPPNKLPPDAQDDNVVTNYGAPIIIDILANDSDPDGVLDPSTVTITTSPTNGTIANIDPLTGKVTYSPDSGFSGQDTFTYKVCDNDGLCDIANVTVGVLSSPPGCIGVCGGITNLPPTPQNDSVSTAVDTPVVIDVLANDTDPDSPLNPGSVTVVTSPTNGSIVSIDPATGKITYTPNSGFSGSDSLTYQVCDTTGLCATATVSINIIAAAKQPPVAVADAAVTDINIPVIINILINDSDADGTLNPASVEIIANPLNGTVSNIDKTTGQIIYTPNLEFFGIDIFEYRVCDNDNLCASAKVSVTINAPGAPLIVPLVALPAPLAPLAPPAPLPLSFGANQFVTIAKTSPITTSGIVQFIINEPQTIYLEAQGATTAKIINLENNVEYPLVYDPDLKLWVGDLGFNQAGYYRLKGEVSNGVQAYSREINTIYVSQKSIISDAVTGGPVAGVAITVYEKDTVANGFKLWNGQSYGQNNPLTADDNGKFSVMLPKGDYYLSVGREGYNSVNSLITNIGDYSVVTAAIRLTPTTSAFQQLASSISGNDVSANFPLVVSPLPPRSLLKEGQAISDIALTDKDGEPVSLFTLMNDKPAVIMAYSSWNTLAQEQLGTFERIARGLGDSFQYVPVSTLEPANTSLSYLRRGAYVMDSYSPDNAFYNDYKIISLPQFFIINANKELVGNIVGSYADSDVVSRIQQMMAGQ